MSIIVHKLSCKYCIIVLTGTQDAYAWYCSSKLLWEGVLPRILLIWCYQVWNPLLSHINNMNLGLADVCSLVVGNLRKPLAIVTKKTSLMEIGDKVDFFDLNVSWSAPYLLSINWTVTLIRFMEFNRFSSFDGNLYITPNQIGNFGRLIALLEDFSREYTMKLLDGQIMRWECETIVSANVDYLIWM